MNLSNDEIEYQKQWKAKDVIDTNKLSAESCKCHENFKELLNDLTNNNAEFYTMIRELNDKISQASIIVNSNNLLIQKLKSSSTC